MYTTYVVKCLRFFSKTFLEAKRFMQKFAYHKLALYLELTSWNRTLLPAIYVVLPKEIQLCIIKRNSLFLGCIFQFKSGFQFSMEQFIAQTLAFCRLVQKSNYYGLICNKMAQSGI